MRRSVEDPITLYLFDGEKEVKESQRASLLGRLKSPLFQVAKEGTSFLQCLNDAKDRRLSKALFIADTSLCACTPETLYTTISEASISRNMDLFYLCKWMDRSNLYTERESLSCGLFAARTYAPHGLQALMIYASGIEYIHSLCSLKHSMSLDSVEREVHRSITKGHLTAYCLIPNIVHFNLLLASSSDDYDRLRETNITAESGTDAKVASNSTYLWFVLISLIVILVLWVLFKAENSE